MLVLPRVARPWENGAQRELLGREIALSLSEARYSSAKSSGSTPPSRTL
jgi:hypothetical protein